MEEIGQAKVHRPKGWSIFLEKEHLIECSRSQLSGLYEKGKLSGRIPGHHIKVIASSVSGFHQKLKQEHEHQ